MPRMRKTGLGGGLATRYGTAPRRRYIDILTRMRRPHECPQCQTRAARRLSVGLWECRRCGFQFAGGAYAPFTKIGDAARRYAKGAAHVTSPAEVSAPTQLGAAEAGLKPKRRRRRTKTEEPPKEET
jgi:large subunit ribosomal protein L37Ae